MYNRLKCKRVQRIHVQKYVAPTQEVCFYQKQSYLFKIIFRHFHYYIIVMIFRVGWGCCYPWGRWIC